MKEVPCRAVSKFKAVFFFFFLYPEFLGPVKVEDIAVVRYLDFPLPAFLRKMIWRIRAIYKVTAVAAFDYSVLDSTSISCYCFIGNAKPPLPYSHG